ncbi:uncharacterized protein LOC125868751 [Solanum stenotomum]|uniref:uncharacterized protein LOC125851776 n=1 Tax=Solanum stenotomum TaxID=172797 RepID=UPI0020D1616F|nr:uncharacterized protein LOC125851776 [Solanum stenotomum]XP_049405280.1 uncharacterized protein LOC125868751 [Solanum stenotomum]
MDLGDGFVSKRRPRQQSLKCMVEIIEKRYELSQSGNSTNGRKRKKMETSGGDERNMENNRRRKFTRGTSESFTNQTFIKEVSANDDSSEEETDPNAVIVEEEEEDSDPGIVIVVEERRMRMRRRSLLIQPYILSRNSNLQLMLFERIRRRFLKSLSF